MSSIDAWLFNNLSLRYLATVKTVSVLYRKSGGLHGIEETVDNILLERDPSKYSPARLVQPMLRRFDSFLDKLMLPTTIKNDLSLCFWQMVQQTCDTQQFRGWIKRSADDSGKTEEVSMLIKNNLRSLHWDAIGRLDHRKTVEVFIRGKETIPYSEWAMLCKYCSEDYIRQYADTIDWKECEFSAITIFWYHAIYGTFPTANMFGSSSYYKVFQQDRDKGYYEKDNINNFLVSYSIFGASRWAARFACNKLTVSQKVELISSITEKILKYAPKHIAIYLLSQIKFNYSSVKPINCAPLRYLLSWPYVMFIDSWIDTFETVDIDHFVTIFTVLMEQRRGEQAAGIEKFSERQIRHYLHVNYHVPCEKLWTLCRKKFDLQNPLVFKIVSTMVNSEDIILCEIVMEESTSTWRQDCLHYIKDSKSDSEFLLNQEFCKKFMKEILLDEKERQVFQEVRDGVCGRREDDKLAQVENDEDPSLFAPILTHSVVGACKQILSQ